MFAILSRHFRKPRRDRERGSMAVEFAFAAPPVIMLALGVVDYGSLMNKWASLRGATRAGAEYVVANWNNATVTDPTTGAEQQVCGFLGLTLSSTTCSPVTPTVATACTCSDDSTVSCPSSGSSNPCSSYSDPRVLVSVTVTATESFTPIASWASFAFPSTVTASTVVRTQ
jgi:Flp pilus assembly protein TadG